MKTTMTLAAALLAGSLAAQLPTGVPAGQPTQVPGVPAASPGAQDAPSVRRAGMVRAPIKAVTQIQSTMSQTLTGVGLVVGLNGAGSTDRDTRQRLQNLINRLGVFVEDTDVINGNVASVIVTATLQPFASEGSRLNVKVMSSSDCNTLYGGELLQCTLHGIDQKVYATAAGPVVSNGLAARGQQATTTQNHPTTGWVENGGQVVVPLRSSFYTEAGHLQLRLIHPSVPNALAITTGCRSALDGMNLPVSAIDTHIVRIQVPAEKRTNEFAMEVIRRVGNVEVPMENETAVILDQAAGVILAGGGVRISPCVVSLSELTISVVQEDFISQPGPGFNRGTTERVGRTRIDVVNDDRPLQQIGGAGATVDELVANLRALSLSPTQMMTVFRTLHAKGYLHANLVLR